MMKANKLALVFGALLVLFGLLIAIGPQTFMTPCPLPAEEGVRPMKCHWAAQADLGIGIVIALLGGLTLIPGSAEFKKGLYLAAAICGILAWATTTKTIGVCANVQMHCLQLMKPGVMVLSILTVAAGGAAAFLMGRADA